jgi:hypothetical protein
MNFKHHHSSVNYEIFKYDLLELAEAIYFMFCMFIRLVNSLILSNIYVKLKLIIIIIIVINIVKKADRNISLQYDLLFN